MPVCRTKCFRQNLRRPVVNLDDIGLPGLGQRGEQIIPVGDGPVEAGRLQRYFQPAHRGRQLEGPLQRRRLALAVRDDRQDLDREIPIHLVHTRQPVALFERTGCDDGGFCADRRWGRLRQDVHLALAARAASAAHRADRNLGQAGGVEERLVGRTLDGSSPGFEADGVGQRRSPRRSELSFERVDWSPYVTVNRQRRISNEVQYARFFAGIAPNWETCVDPLRMT